MRHAASGVASSRRALPQPPGDSKVQQPQRLPGSVPSNIVPTSLFALPCPAPLCPAPWLAAHLAAAACAARRPCRPGRCSCPPPPHSSPACSTCSPHGRKATSQSRVLSTGQRTGRREHRAESIEQRSPCTGALLPAGLRAQMCAGRAPPPPPTTCPPAPPAHPPARLTRSAARTAWWQSGSRSRSGHSSVPGAEQSKRRA